MGDDAPSGEGRILWTDLTVPDADRVRAFYEEVAGWRWAPVSMGEYDDFNMLAPGSEQPVAGICHARGPNAGLPAQWLIYIGVKDLDASIERCLALDGEVVSGPTSGDHRMCVVRDPAGAVAALYQTPGA